jgi:hypothetical protein
MSFVQRTLRSRLVHAASALAVLWPSFTNAACVEPSSSYVRAWTQVGPMGSPDTSTHPPAPFFSFLEPASSLHGGQGSVCYDGDFAAPHAAGNHWRSMETYGEQWAVSGTSGSYRGGAASALASGRLDTGALKVAIDSSKSNEVAGRGSASATLVETLVFHRSGAPSSSPARVSFSLDVSGRIADSGYELPSPGIGAFLSVAYKLHPNSGSYSGVSDSVLFSGSGLYQEFLFAEFEMDDYAEVLLQVTLQSPVFSLGVAAGGSSIDFGHSAYVAVVTSPDVTWTSGSGVFLTAAATVPEPSTTGLLALPLFVLALRARRREPVS